jgi:hypothetical protein
MSEELVKDRIIPEAAQKRAPDWIQCIREKYALPVDWDFVVFTAKGEGLGEYFEVTGGVYKTPFKSCLRKGEINRRAPEPGTGCTVVLPRIEYKAWLEKWERDTGLCAPCSGSGFTLRSCGVSGTIYRKCSKCDGTGLPKKQEAA